MHFIRTAVFVGLSLTLLQSGFANSESETEKKITSFLLGEQASADAGHFLILNDVTAAYNTKITFTQNNEFLRSDGVRGMWHIEDGKLVLKGLDTEGFTMVFNPQSLTANQMSGRFTKGRWKNNKLLLKLPIPSDAKNTAKD